MDRRRGKIAGRACTRRVGTDGTTHKLHIKRDDSSTIVARTLRRLGCSQTGQNPNDSSGRSVGVSLDNVRQGVDGLVECKVVRRTRVDAPIADSADAVVEGEANEFGGEIAVDNRLDLRFGAHNGLSRGQPRQWLTSAAGPAEQAAENIAKQARKGGL